MLRALLARGDDNNPLEVRNSILCNGICTDAIFNWREDILDIFVIKMNINLKMNIGLANISHFLFMKKDDAYYSVETFFFFFLYELK